MFKSLKANSAQLLSSVILALFSSYWVTGFHKDFNKEISQLDWFIEQITNDYLFLFITFIFILLIVLSVYNVFVVVKINSSYIPMLREILSNDFKGKTPTQIIDSFATIHSFFRISETKDTNGNILEIIIRPIRLTTYFVSIKNAKFIVKFNKSEKSLDYIYEEE